MIAVTNIAEHFHWDPDRIAEMYIDDLDEFGLLFWNNYIVEQEKKLKKK